MLLTQFGHISLDFQFLDLILHANASGKTRLESHLIHSQAESKLPEI